MPVPILSLAQMRQWENATWAAGRTEAEIIRRVGRRIAERALSLTRPGDRIVVLAGKGHNGDDARQAGRHLSRRKVELLNVVDPETAFAELEAFLSTPTSLVIDGLFGIGLNRPLSRSWIRLIESLNRSAVRVLAVDIPSGLSGDHGEPQGAAIEAFITLTVGAPKKGLLESSAWPFVGRLEVADDVGLSEKIPASEQQWTIAEDFCAFSPRRPVAGHKGTFGHVAIVAGSAGYHGAAVLAGRGAQRARPGLVTVFPQSSAYLPVAAQAQSVMVQAWSLELELPGPFSAVLIGPGLAAPDLPAELKARAQHLWQQAAVPVIADASALAWLPRGPVRTKAARVITPHPGEAARLLNRTSAEIQARRIPSLRALSKRFGDAWVVLKGHQTIVGRNRGEVFVNSSGNPGLAQGGAGDLLAGFLAGLLAQPALQADPLKTIRYAVWKHGAAADALEGDRSNWTVEDLATVLGA